MSVGIVMGSDSDWPVMKAAGEALTELGVAWEADVVSAHRMPEEMLDYGRQAADRGLEGFAQPRQVDPGAREQRGRAAVFLRNQGAEEMDRLDIGIVVAHGQALRVGERLLEFGGEFV